MKILIVSSEIIKNKYSASIRVYKFLESIPLNIDYDILTEPMTVFDFEHRAVNIFMTDYRYSGPKKNKTVGDKIFYKVFNKDYTLNKRSDAFLKGLKKIQLNDYDTIISFSGGGFFGPQLAMSKITTTATRVAYIHDPYPNDIYPEPYKTETTRFTIQAKKDFQQIIDGNDKYAFPSKLLSIWMQKYYEFSASNAVILPHLIPNISTSVKAKSEADEILKKYNLITGKFYLHAGTLFKHRPIHDIIKEFEKLKHKGKFNSDFKLVFIGTIKYELETQNEDIVIINERQELDTINSISNHAKSLMIIEHHGKFSPFLPGKLPECIAHKKPIMHFGPTNSEVCRVAKLGTSIMNFSAELNDTEQISHLLLSGGEDLSEYPEIIEHFNIERFFKQLSSYGK